MKSEPQALALATQARFSRESFAIGVQNAFERLREPA
jgi:hypothetical protein